MDKKPKQYEDDDGRVICGMDVEGMRWHGRRPSYNTSGAPNVPQGAGMTDAEARKYSWYSLLAGLLIVAVFSVTWILFVLFCTQIWFR